MTGLTGLLGVVVLVALTSNHCGSCGNDTGNDDDFPYRRTAFLMDYPGYNVEVEEVAARELTRMGDQVYLDYTGSGVYQNSQIEDVFDDLKGNAYGNAHSRNPSAALTDLRLEEARRLVLDSLNAKSGDFHIVFTSGATGALKMIGEDFPWTRRSLFYYLRINHNSVLGMREYVAERGATFKALSSAEVEELLDTRKAQNKTNAPCDDICDSADPMKPCCHRCLFAYPPKDNFAGSFYPLSWVSDVQRYGLSDRCKWHVVLDAAAYVPVNTLDLSLYQADFTAISFYKMFGYPTGVGALILANKNAAVIKKIYWGGGSVVAAVCDSRWCKQKDNPSLRFEDGTVAFLNIVALKYGYQKLQQFGIVNISKHVAALTEYMARKLRSLKHSNGDEVVVIYHDWNQPVTGGIVNFNVLLPLRGHVHFAEVEHEASKAGMHVRAGCFCNPGACQDYLGLSNQEIMDTSTFRASCSDPASGQISKPLGSVRASLGYLTTFRDVDRFINFIELKFVE